MGWCRMMCDIGRRKGITGGGLDGWKWRGGDIGGYRVGGSGGCAGSCVNGQWVGYGVSSCDGSIMFIVCGMVE